VMFAPKHHPQIERRAITKADLDGLLAGFPVYRSLFKNVRSGNRTLSSHILTSPRSDGSLYTPV
jgi:hypothetical protein